VEAIDTTAPGEIAAQQLAKLARHLLDRDTGREFGKLSRVARRLGINQSYLTKILSGERKSVGMETVEAVVQSCSVPRDYFVSLSAAPSVAPRRGNRYVRAKGTNTFADLIAMHLAFAEMPRDEFIRRAKISRAALHTWETSDRRPRADTLRRIADVLGVPIDALLSGPAPRTRKNALSVFGDRLRALMAQAGIGRSELLAKLGVSHMTLYRWETSGTTLPTGRHLLDLAKALRSTPEFILTGADHCAPSPITQRVQWAKTIREALTLGMCKGEKPEHCEVCAKKHTALDAVDALLASGSTS